MSAVSAASPPGPVRLGLIGSPNSGKTTLFNALTGLRAKVGNYPGVTVERREGSLVLEGRDARLIDLPGTYSLDPISPDEAVVSQVLAGEVEGVAPPEALVIVADACSLERSLLLIAQVVAEDRPTCLVLTMMDELAVRGGSLDTSRLQDALGIPVVPVVGHKGLGIRQLRVLLADPEAWSRPPVLPPENRLEQSAWIDSVMSACGAERPDVHAATERIDRVVVHPILGSLLFLAVMLTFFQLIFAWATPAMDWIDGAMGTAADFARGLLPAGLFADFVADGLIAGVGSVVIFLPQIVLLFSLLYLLEDVGYMARAAFVVDRAMARIGLEGRAFVALLSSFACAVPGIMATRTMPSPRDRLVTILVAPLMTCSARLPVYALLIAAFVPQEAAWGPFGMQGLVLFALYIVAPLTAMAVAAVLRRSLLPGEGMPFILELPSYRVPGLRLWLSQVWGSAWAFLRRAGTIILLASMVLWMLLTFPRTEPPANLGPEQAAAYSLERSAAGRVGKAIEPAIAPLGFDWKIGVGLLASLAAREVFVSTLAQVYATEDPDASLRAAIRADTNPVTGEKIFSPATVAALLTFFVFALQCTSTIATIARETNSWRWPTFAFGYMLALAYGGALLARHITLALT
jgi:ferrous iron transport protein B